MAAGARVKARPSLNGFNLPCSRCCIFFSCNFELLGDKAPLDWLGVVDPAGAGFDLASAADASLESALEIYVEGYARAGILLLDATNQHQKSLKLGVVAIALPEIDELTDHLKVSPR